LSKGRVLRAAVELADEFGLESVSMRKLGQALRVEAMSLYKHVANRDAVLDGMVELVVGEIDWSAGSGSWRESLRQRALATHAVLMRHPWACMLIASRVNVGPAMLHYADATLGCMRRAGFSHALADHAWNAMDSYVYGFTLQRLNFPLRPSEYVSAAKSFLPQIPPTEFPHLHGLARQVIDGRHDGLHDLSFGLDLLLDGLERMAPAPRAAVRGIQ